MADRTVFVCLCTVIQLQYAGEADQRRDGTVLEEWGTGEWGSRWQDERLTSIPHYHLYHQLLSHLISWIISVSSTINCLVTHRSSISSSKFLSKWFFDIFDISTMKCQLLIFWSITYKESKVQAIFDLNCFSWLEQQYFQDKNHPLKTNLEAQHPLYSNSLSFLPMDLFLPQHSNNFFEVEHFQQFCKIHKI